MGCTVRPSSRGVHVDGGAGGEWHNEVATAVRGDVEGVVEPQEGQSDGGDEAAIPLEFDDGVIAEVHDVQCARAVCSDPGQLEWSAPSARLTCDGGGDVDGREGSAGEVGDVQDGAPS